MANELYQFMNEAGVRNLAEQLLGKVNVRIQERIVTEVNANSSDKQVASAKALYTLINSMQAANTEINNRLDEHDAQLTNNGQALADISELQGTHATKIGTLEADLESLQNVVNNLTHLNIETVTGPISSITEPRADILYLQRDNEEDKTWMMYIYQGNGQPSLEYDIELTADHFTSITDDGVAEYNPESAAVEKGTIFIPSEVNVGTEEAPEYKQITTIKGFNDSQSLKSAIIAEGIEFIDHYGFNNCGSLKSIVIPASLTSIGTGAFDSCTDLETVYFAGTDRQWFDLMNNTDVANDPFKYANVVYNYTGSTDDDWINIGDTEVNLSNYWSKDNIAELREALNIHDVEPITDAQIISAVDAAFANTAVTLTD